MFLISSISTVLADANPEPGTLPSGVISVPGGSVAAQTGDSSNYAIPSRIFDSREKVLNVIN